MAPGTLSLAVLTRRFAASVLMRHRRSDTRLR